MSYIQPKTNMVNYFYYDPKVLDLSKIRDEAVAVTKDGKKLATIHYHRLADRCFGKEHEDYKDGTRVDKLSEEDD